MTANRVFHLSNLAAGQEFDLAVADGSDALTAAQAHLEESGLNGDLQRGFYISVYPRSPEGDAPTSVHTIDSDLQPTDSGTGDDVAILA